MSDKTGFLEIILEIASSMKVWNTTYKQNVDTALVQLIIVYKAMGPNKATSLVWGQWDA